MAEIPIDGHCLNGKDPLMNDGSQRTANRDHNSAHECDPKARLRLPDPKQQTDMAVALHSSPALLKRQQELRTKKRMGRSSPYALCTSILQ